MTVARNYHADPRKGGGGVGVENVQVPRSTPSPPPENLTDLGPARDPSLPWQPTAALLARARHGARPAYFLPMRTVRRFRPRLRRRLSVCRPPRVRMRLRNPCLFFRFRFLGLYVGLPIKHPSIVVDCKDF
jgi:hypothetical protein